MPGKQQMPEHYSTLFPSMEKPVAQSIQDCWRGYNGLIAGGFSEHLTVNHSQNFVHKTKQEPTQTPSNRSGIHSAKLYEEAAFIKKT